MKEQATYRDQIQDLIEQINHIYDAAGNLRDFATEEEKQYWNAIRKMFYSETAAPLRMLDNKLDKSRALQKMPNYAKRGNNQTEMF